MKFRKLSSFIMIKIAYLCILFLLRTRFPIGQSIASIIRKRYGIHTLRLQRKLESLDTKLRKAKLDLEFLNSCRDNGLIPHFLQFRLANERLRHSSSYPACQRRFLDEEIKNKASSIRHLLNQLSDIFELFKNSVSILDFVHISCKLSRSVDCTTANQQAIQIRKLERLQLEKSRNQTDPDKVIFNFSTHILTSAQKKLLAKRTKFLYSTKTAT